MRDMVKRLPVGGIYDACFHGLYQFERIKLTDETIGFNPANVFEEMKIGGSRLYGWDVFEAKTRWVDWPDVSSSQDASCTREEIFARWINRIGQFVGESLGKTDAPRKWTAQYCNTPVPHHKYKRKPDLVLMRTADAESPEISNSKNWSSIFAVGEFSSGASLGLPLMRLAQYAELIFSEQPDRTDVLGFVVQQESMYYTVFNKSGLFTSDKFNIHEDPERLIRIVSGMMHANREAIGFDPTMKITTFDETEPFEPYVEVNENKYVVMETLHVKSVIRGQAASVFKAKRIKTNKNTADECSLVKNGWVAHQKGNDSDIPSIPDDATYEIEAKNVTSRDDFDEWCRLNSLEDAMKTMSGRMDCRKQVRVAIVPVYTPAIYFKSLKMVRQVFTEVTDTSDVLRTVEYIACDISDKDARIDGVSESRNCLKKIPPSTVPDTFQRGAFCDRTRDHSAIGITPDLLWMCGDAGLYARMLVSGTPELEGHSGILWSSRQISSA